MKSQGELDRAEWKRERPAVLHAVGFFDSLFLQPAGDFVICDDRRPGSFGDRDRVADMIAVTVRHENKVCGDSISFDRRFRVTAQKRVDQDVDAIAFE